MHNPGCIIKLFRYMQLLRALIWKRSEIYCYIYWFTVWNASPNVAEPFIYFCPIKFISFGIMPEYYSSLSVIHWFSQSKSTMTPWNDSLVSMPFAYLWWLLWEHDTNYGMALTRHELFFLTKNVFVGFTARNIRIFFWKYAHRCRII